ncbi:MAG: NTP transferase domain-containing protein [Bacteroidaceae bacterium]|nr:NTP transferase domain-containing protein [Bacteroidaceae bacterium]
MKAMIFAAGLGTRLAPLTNDRPKALVQLRGKSLLWHVAERLASEGFRDLTVNVHHFAQQIKDYIQGGPFAEWAAANHLHFSISDESDQLLDTGGGLRKAATLLFAHDDAPVLIHNVDIISNARLDELYHSIGGADALLLVSERQTSRYLLFDHDMRLVGWQNIKTGEVRTPYPDLHPDHCQRLAFSGIHVVSKDLIDRMSDWPPIFSIIDFYIANCRTLDIRGYIQPDLTLTDIGKIEVLEALNIEN